MVVWDFRCLRVLKVVPIFVLASCGDMRTPPPDLGGEKPKIQGEPSKSQSDKPVESLRKKPEESTVDGSLDSRIKNLEKLVTIQQAQIDFLRNQLENSRPLASSSNHPVKRKVGIEDIQTGFKALRNLEEWPGMKELIAEAQERPDTKNFAKVFFEIIKDAEQPIMDVISQAVEVSKETMSNDETYKKNFVDTSWESLPAPVKMVGREKLGWDEKMFELRNKILGE